MALDLTDDLEVLESVFEQTITWNGADYPCHVSSARRGAKLEDGGFAIESDLSVTVRTNLFSTRPQKKQTFIYDSNTYRIDEVITPPGASFLHLRASHDAKGA